MSEYIEKDLDYINGKTYIGKRVLDIFLALVILFFLSPLLFIISIMVKLSSKGPVLYRGRRVGLKGKVFKQNKFRTMKMGLSGSSFTGKDDPRITPLGNLLRIFKLDELPQLINVLQGDMSVVGPRPEDVDLVNNIFTSKQMRVFSVKPGITSEIVIKYFPDYTYYMPTIESSEKYYQEILLKSRLQEDMKYIDSMSFLLDLKIIYQTIICILVKSWGFMWKRYFSSN